MSSRFVRRTNYRAKTCVQSPFARVVDYFGAWNVVGKKGLHAAFKQIRVHGIGEFLPRIYTKGDLFHSDTLTGVYPVFISVAHGGRNVYYLKEDVERFADEASTIRTSGRDLLDLANRCESLREVRSSVSEFPAYITAR
jgi:hypothetical protein